MIIKPAVFSSIILIDDSEIDNFINQKLLETYGFPIIRTFSNARDALKFLLDAEERYDLIIVDVYMPITSGYEFIEQFSKLKLHKKHGQVCLLSATVNPLALKKAKELNAVLIEKPLKIEKLLELGVT